MNSEPLEHSQELRGKTSLITGGSTEIAAVVASVLASKGVKVCLCGGQPDLLELATMKARDQGGICIPILSNLDSLEAAQSVLEQTLASFKRLDFLIVISPFWAGGLIHEHSLKTWDAVMDGNLRQAFLMARVVLPVFRAQKRGEVMAIGSDSGLGNYPQEGAFGVAMHGLIALMEQIRLENQDYGIRAHILCPGVASSGESDASGHATLSTKQVADWVVWLLTRPAHLRSNGPILL
jgi:3-oxoacyl-[acyl-carrier protein] reductase